MLFSVGNMSPLHLLDNLAESFIKNVFCDIVKPRIGSIVKVDLVGGVLNHTGIYVGNNEIVEVANIDGSAVVQKVSTDEFINGFDNSLFRTGVYIYVACKQNRKGNCIAMGSQDIADRAIDSIGKTSEYSLVFNNCHLFTQYCITGIEDYNKHSGILLGIEADLEKKFIRQDYERLPDMWRSTGISMS